MSGYADQDDAALAALICMGNQAAFAELVERHTDRFFALAFRTLLNRGDAEDIVQSAFIKFWQKPTLWKSSRSKFTTWFYQVVLNACRDFQRKSQRQVLTAPEQLESSCGTVVSEQDLAEDTQASNKRKQLLHAGLRTLPLAQRDAINLVVYCELPQKQAAEVMGIKLKALESLLQRAKKGLASFVDANIAADQRDIGELNQVKVG